ncbi:MULTISPECIES: serine hydroxymethyltransferase [unclassified Lactococcus]|uniref:serine hydroxymethyltransferase n=1 Tax=unclassified Lactococcus TaxID=2643510 RepID=UPI0011CA06A2|nr:MULTISPECIES: serine hydroxymethyltransferase [unclassified Lactococcus]MQW23859.1 serine hydroxymethyltransferase [Lactococcus sp. dk101]TXK37210.1 serine hydroxymethyltransferase [Lactococcus sp. dk310]TXK48107.1 serine hydroxymethyltransferase [Lactococcus sp. dk322]
MKLTKNQQELLHIMYRVILDTRITEMERLLFTKTKSQIEFGRTFDKELNALLNELDFIPNSISTRDFRDEVLKRLPV